MSRGALCCALLALAAAAEPAGPGVEPAAPAPPAVEPGAPEPEPPEPEPWLPLELLGEAVAPGERRRLSLVVSRSFAGAQVRTPVLVLRGAGPGPTLCLTAGVHGDEVNGVEVVRRVADRIDPAVLQGTVIAVPIVNLPAFRRGSRYLPDRRDLNRYFPGRPQGSAASRIAHAFFEEVVRRCDALVDMHTGSFHRTNLHQLRADLRNPAILDLARGFGAPIIVHSEGRLGTLRRAATEVGIPAITLEAGEPARFSRQEVELGITGTLQLLAQLVMLDVPVAAPPAIQLVFQRTRWVRADDGGILVSDVALGQPVLTGQLLGTVSDPLSQRTSEIRSPYRGRVIGLAFDQLVMPGFAAFHIALEGAQQSPEGPELWPADTGEAEDERDGLDLDERPE